MSVVHFVTRQNSHFLLSLLRSQFKPKPSLPLSFSNLSHVSSSDTFFQKAQALMSLFKPCSAIKDLKLIHARILKSGFGQDLFAMGKLIELSSLFGDTDYAASAFDSLETPDGFVWNTMIRAFGESGEPEKAIDFHRRMSGEGESPDSFTFAFLLKVSSQTGSANLAKQLHGSALKHGLDSQLIVRNVLIHVYGVLGETENAAKLFDEMPSRDLVTWNTIINCHVCSGNCIEALRLFSRMLRNQICPDETTFLSALSACSNLGVLDFGRQIHSHIYAFGFRFSIPVSNSIIHVYAQCGAIEQAKRAFEGIGEKNLVSWNTAILGLGTHGRGEEALALFSKMVSENLESPDEITFLGVLSACSRCGMVDEARQYLDVMQREYRIEPTAKHYGCVVDMLGRVGSVEAAYRLIASGPMDCNPVLWRTLLAACRIHGKIELGRRVIERLSELEPDHSGDFVLLGNIYASAGEWNEAIRVRESMREMRIQKREPGYSFVGNYFMNYKV